MLKLIRLWLQAPMVEPSQGGSPDSTGKGFHPQRGTPQGGVASPLPANLYLHWFDYPRHAFRQTNGYVRKRLAIHLQRRSQRAYLLPEGLTYYAQRKRMGLIFL